jgi:hypothetical protein
MMQTLFAILRWFAPAMVIPLSYMSFRYLPGRRLRLWLYFVVLVAVGVFDLFRLSFTAELADLLLRQAVLFMVAEFIWLIALIRSPVAVATAALVVAGLWAAANRDWLGAGPRGVAYVWRAPVASSHPAGSSTYVVKERKRPFEDPPHRRFVLMKRFSSVPVEQTIKSYTTPEGYYRSAFGFAWHTAPQGVRVDLWVGPDTLWTLGVGL